MDRLLVLGTGNSLKEGTSEIREFKGDILAWSHAYIYCLQNGIVPKLWSYVDPHSSIAAFKYILNTPKRVEFNPQNTNGHCIFLTDLILFAPALTEGYKQFNRYIGTAQDMDGKAYNEQYRGLLQASKPYLKHTHIDIDTTRHNPALDDKDIFFCEKELILNHRFCEDKLLFAILPLVNFLGYSDITLIGFEGKGPRYMAKKPIPHNIAAIQKLRKQYLGEWIKYFDSKGVRIQ